MSPDLLAYCERKPCQSQCRQMEAFDFEELCWQGKKTVATERTVAFLSWAEVGALIWWIYEDYYQGRQNRNRTAYAIGAAAAVARMGMLLHCEG